MQQLTALLEMALGQTFLHKQQTLAALINYIEKIL